MYQPHLVIDSCLVLVKGSILGVLNLHLVCVTGYPSQSEPQYWPAASTSTESVGSDERTTTGLQSCAVSSESSTS